MATWEGRKPTKYNEYTGADYAKTEMNWSYGTVSDTLTINIKQGEYSDWAKTHKPSEFVEHMSKDKALAMLEQLADWCNQYEGHEKLEEILKKIREE